MSKLPITTDEIEKRLSALEEHSHVPFDFTELIERIEALEAAAPANSRAEAIGAREAAIRECIAAVELYAASYSTMSKIGNGNVSASDVAYDMRENIIGKNLRALLDNPQPDSRAEAIGVKPLEWKAVRKAVIGADGYEITDMSAGNKQGWRGSFPGENTYRWFSTIEDAQDAAQGHYLRALLQQEGE